MKYFIWAILWIPLFLIGLAFRILSPLAVCFVTRAPYLTTVKRLDSKLTLLNRDRLVWWLTWFDTDDNATDEYWYGLYDASSLWGQADYDNSRCIRWYCRMMWLQRNSAYTFNRKFFGIAKDSWLHWQYKTIKPFLFGKVNDINIGWKEHSGQDKLLYAGRVLGVRTPKQQG